MRKDQLSLLITNCVFLSLSIIVILFRCWARISIRGWAYDDVMMVIAEIFFIAIAIDLIVGCHWGIGVPDEFLTLTDIENAIRCFTLSTYLYVVCFTFVKASISLSLIRIATQKAIRRICYAVIVWCVVCCFIAIVVALTYCHPISALWTGKGHCGSPTTIVTMEYFVFVTAIITDFICAILPSIMLRRLQMERKLKVTIVFVLSLGFLASAATLVRQRYIKNFFTRENFAQEIAVPSLWSTVELGLGIISGSLPVLRPLLSRVFKTVFASSPEKVAGSSPPDSTSQCDKDLENQAVNLSMDDLTVATSTGYTDSCLSTGGVKDSTPVVEDMSQGHCNQGRSI
ncbi:hypothetical protein BDV97DRAFT_4316 [Delphinella strobiligena]|nr:hypothetical protein BDV97DRAFT_4316 [Delphinella strobiligena]